MESLSPSVIRSGFWSLGGNWLSRGLSIVKLVILARLLSPLDFGILGLAILSINIINVFSETGIESALIQKEQISKNDLDTAWTIASAHEEKSKKNTVREIEPESTIDYGSVCPDCGGVLEASENCLVCRACGYTKCG